MRPSTEKGIAGSLVQLTEKSGLHGIRERFAAILGNHDLDRRQTSLDSIIRGVKIGDDQRAIRHHFWLRPLHGAIRLQDTLTLFLLLFLQLFFLAFRLIGAGVGVEIRVALGFTEEVLGLIDFFCRQRGRIRPRAGWRLHQR